MRGKQRDYEDGNVMAANLILADRAFDGSVLREWALGYLAAHPQDKPQERSGTPARTALVQLAFWRRR